MAQDKVLDAGTQTVTSQGQGSLIDEVLAETKMRPSDEAYGIAREGVQALMKELLKPNAAPGVNRNAIDSMIGEIDKRLEAQVNAILHEKNFQKLESSWRSLRYLMENIQFRENIKVEILNVSKEDLAADLEDAADLSRSGFFKVAYSDEYGQFGGEPYGVILGNFDVNPNAPDMQMLNRVAAVAAMTHAPFITNAGPEFFGSETFEGLPKLKDLKSLLEGPQYAKWNGFRENPDSCYVGLCMPRFLLRVPYNERDNPVKAFNFTEEVVGTHNNYLWGHASTAMATRIAESFAEYRWCPNIIGPQSGGTVRNLPLHQYEAMGEVQTKVPTEVMLTERREYELSEEGFIPLTFRKDSDNACFFSANSAQKPKFFGNSPEAKAEETNFRLGTQLPYMFVITRLAHYLKVIQREQLGSFKERVDLERELNAWIGQYVSDMDNPAPGVRARRPLRKARIMVEDVPGQAGWYQCKIEVQPHIKYMGASFTLSLVGRLDKGK